MNTEEIRVVVVEQVDDIPVILGTLRRLRLAELFDRHYPTHHLWRGELSPGEVVAVWLTFLLDAPSSDSWQSFDEVDREAVRGEEAWERLEARMTATASQKVDKLRNAPSGDARIPPPQQTEEKRSA